MRLFPNQRLTGACNQALFSNWHMAMTKEVKGYFSNKIKYLPALKFFFMKYYNILSQKW